jgi:signal transduction histidine kinase/ligand-binding sensor domain-containing protein
MLLHPKHLRSALVFTGLLAFSSGTTARSATVDDAAQYYARTWMTEDGLPHNVVAHIVQDRSGCIWMGTSGGLSRFDGREFKIYPLPPEMGRRGYNIRGLAEGPSGLLVLLPNDTLVQFDGRLFRPHPMNASLGGKTLTDLYVEPSGVIWVGTWDGTLFRWQNGETVSFGKADGIDRRLTAFSFAIDGQGRTWIATGNYLGSYSGGKLTRFGGRLGRSLLIGPSHSGGVWLLSDSRLLKLDDGRMVEATASSGRLPANVFPHSLHEDRDQTVWIATLGQGLYCFSQGRLDHLPYPRNSTLFVTDDREGDIWVGTDGRGVSMLRPKAFSLFNAGASPDISRSVCEDQIGNVWFVDRQGGLMRNQGEGFEPVATNLRIFVDSICPDHRGSLWIGARDGLYRLSGDQTGPPEKIDTTLRDIRKLFCARDGDVWVAAQSGGIGVIRDGQFRLFSPAEAGGGHDRAASFAEDGSGTIWCGNEGGALTRFRLGKWEQVPLPAGIPVLPIHVLFGDSSDSLWIGTADGLLLYRRGAFKRFAEADGLTDAMIFQIQQDDSGHLWLGSRRGLYRVDMDQLLAIADGQRAQADVLTLGNDDGVPGISLRMGGQPLSWKDRNGKLWFTTDQGVLAFSPAAIAVPSPHSPVLIEQASIDGRIEPEEDLRVPSGRHRIEFRFTALTYAAPDKVMLRHQLVGIDPGWIESSVARVAAYSSLPPGSYRFRVVAGDEDGAAQSSEATLTFRVIPAWWQRLWVKAGAAFMVAAASAWGIHHRSQRKLKNKLEQSERAHALEKERARIARDLHDELGSSLTRIAFLVDRLKRQARAQEAVSLLAQLEQRVRRHSSDLRRVVWTVSPANNTVDRLVAFVGRFAQSFFGDSPIGCQVRIAGKVSSRATTPEVQHHVLSIVKEAFTNILRHSHAGHVTVETKETDAMLEIEIRDDGVGFAPEAKSDDDHNGLTNMRARMAEIGGALEISTEPGKGTAVLIRVAPWAHAVRVNQAAS